MENPTDSSLGQNTKRHNPETLKNGNDQVMTDDSNIKESPENHRDIKSSKKPKPGRDENAGVDFDQPLDIYVTEIKRVKETGKDSLVVDSVLIDHDDLKELAAKNSSSVSNLPLSKLRSRFRPGYFCLKTKNLARLDSSTTLASYAKREPKAVSKDTETQSLEVYWTTASRAELEIPDEREIGLGKADKNKSNFDSKLGLEDVSNADKLGSSRDIKIDKAGTWSALTEMGQGVWHGLIDRNQLLHAFQIDSDALERLRSTDLSVYLSPGEKPGISEEPDPGTTAEGSGEKEAEVKAKDTSSSAKGLGEKKAEAEAIDTSNSAQVTTASASEPIVPIRRSARPIFEMIPQKDSKNKETQLSSSSSSSMIELRPGKFWSYAKSVSTTSIHKTSTSESHWSLVGGMSKKTFSAGLSFPIGKATVGGKFGYTHESSHQEETSNAKSEDQMTAIHSIPVVQINLDETTVRLTPDAEEDIWRMRKERKFADLITFFGKYGMTAFQNITLSGRLWHTQYMTSYKNANGETKEESYEKSANGSVGIPEVFRVQAGYASQRTNLQKSANEDKQRRTFLNWSSIGGDARLVVDPPRWRDSLNQPGNWRPISYDNAVRIDHLIGRLPGFSDVPMLFADIIASGVLNRDFIALPAEGLLAPNASGQREEAQWIKLGSVIEVATGKVISGGIDAETEEQNRSEVSPEGYSWQAVYTDRGLIKEIRAGLQTTMNIAVNLFVKIPVLGDLIVGHESFSVVLRWNTATMRSSYESESAEKKIEPATEDSATTTPTTTNPTTTAPVTTAPVTTTPATTTPATTAPATTTPATTTPATTDPTTTNPAITDPTTTDLLNTDPAVKNLVTAEPATTALGITEPATVKPVAIAPVITDAPTKDSADNEPKKESEANPEEKPKGKKSTPEYVLLSKADSRAWMTGVWRFRRTAHTPITKFEELRLSVAKYFSEPRGIEEGCDYISKLMQTKEDALLEIEFQLRASDGSSQKEVVAKAWDAPKYAFNAISRCMRLSSINVLKVSGQVVPHDNNGKSAGGEPPKEYDVLLNQEAQFMLVYLDVRSGELLRQVQDVLASFGTQKTKLETVRASLKDNRVKLDLGADFDGLDAKSGELLRQTQETVTSLGAQKEKVDSIRADLLVKAGKMIPETDFARLDAHTSALDGIEEAVSSAGLRWSSDDEAIEAMVAITKNL